MEMAVLPIQCTRYGRTQCQIKADSASVSMPLFHFELKVESQSNKMMSVYSDSTVLHI